MSVLTKKKELYHLFEVLLPSRNNITFASTTDFAAKSFRMFRNRKKKFPAYNGLDGGLKYEAMKKKERNLQTKEITKSYSEFECVVES